jgi:hypothetical protein
MKLNDIKKMFPNLEVELIDSKFDPKGRMISPRRYALRRDKSTCGEYVPEDSRILYEWCWEEEIYHRNEEDEK